MPGIEILSTTTTSSESTGTSTLRQSAISPVVDVSPSTMRYAGKPDKVSRPISSTRRDAPGSTAVFLADVSKSVPKAHAM